MKGRRTQRRIRLILALTLIAACERATAPEDGQLVGFWDGRLWSGDASATLMTGAPGGNVLYLFGTTPRGADASAADEVLSARVFFEGPGLYTLGPDDVYLMELSGGDVVLAEYRGVGDRSGLLRITRYDESTRSIEGELRFAARTDSPYASYGSSARFEAGRFRTRVAIQPVNVRATSP